MKSLIGGIILFLILISLSVKNTEAHLIGQPPFFKINSIYSDLYDVPIASNFFEVSQDKPPTIYLINENIEFEIDTTALPVPPEILKKTNFIWDFGDGVQGTGLKNSHAYSKQGSFLLTIDAQYEDVPATLLQSVVVNVLPDKNYQLPNAVITVNGKQPNDPLVDFFNIKYGQEIKFEATKSEGKSGKIVDYKWDFGDSQNGNGSEITHTYREDLTQQQVFAILRVTDENGLYNDTYVQINNGSDSGGQGSGKHKTQSNIVIAIVIAVPVLLFLIYFAKIFLRKKKV